VAARHGVDVHSEIASAQPRPSPMDGVARWTEEVDDLADTSNIDGAISLALKEGRCVVVEGPDQAGARRQLGARAEPGRIEAAPVGHTPDLERLRSAPAEESPAGAWHPWSCVLKRRSGEEAGVEPSTTISTVRTAAARATSTTRAVKRKTTRRTAAAGTGWVWSGVA